MLTLSQLRSVLHYDPSTGVFTWLMKRGGNSAGSAAGGLRPDGYVRLAVFGKQYLGHRLAFFWMKGRWPDPECDHEDLVRSNNRWSNLREASKSQNKANIAAPSTNTSGIKGVGWHKKSQKWRATIKRDQKAIHLGLFETQEAARAAYIAAANTQFGSFARAA